MADASTEIDRLQNELNRTTHEMESMNRAYQRKLDDEIRQVRQNYGRGMQKMEQDLQSRFRALEASVTSAYLQEIQDMRARYNALQKEADRLTGELQKEVAILRHRQQEYLNQKQREDENLRKAALDAQRRLHEALLHAGQYPIETFYPHKLQIYRDAGDAAEKLLKQKIYVLSAAQYESAILGIKRLENDAQRQMAELTFMFDLYRAKLERIDQALSLGAVHCLKSEDGTVLLEMDDEDLDYWSDCLYGHLLAELAEHRKIAEAGADAWIKVHTGNAMPPTVLLDKQIQRLDTVPKRINLCVSYAMSACDSFNCLIDFRETLTQILREQNFHYIDTQFGPLRMERIASEGFTRYAEYLAAESCYCDGSPDYREERIARFEKQHPDGSTDVCSVTFVPVRNGSTVSCSIYLSITAQSLQQQISQDLERLIRQAGIPVQIVLSEQKAAADRPLRTVELERLSGIPNPRQLLAK